MTVPTAKMVFTRYQMAARHFWNIKRHLTARKLLNLARNEVELRRKQTVLKSLPYFIKVEPTAFCQLRCLGCPHGRGEASKYTRDDVFPLDEFKRLIDGLSGALFGVSLSFRGEPLMNRNLIEMMAYCHERNVGTEFPTNLSMKLSEEEIEQLVRSGADHIMVSIDGITQDVYEWYRKGGNLSLVLHNASMMIETKRRLKSRLPLIEFKYILFDCNREQLAEAERLSRRMGFDRFSVVENTFSPTGEETLDRAKSVNLSKGRACYWPWSSAVVHYDGTVWACCQAKFDLGNVFETPFEEIWNSQGYQTLRSFFRSYTKNDLSHYCEKCMHF